LRIIRVEEIISMRAEPMKKISPGAEKTRCPYLQKWVGSHCRISEKPYYPSIFELQEYCGTRNYSKCPLIFRGARYQFDALG
jgi:hypothetical protein